MDLIHTKNYSSNFFYFKNFKLSHNKSTMKIGTDSMILGAYTQHNNYKKILDIGTGCGVLAFMMAQKYVDSHIIGIDIDKNSIEEANENKHLFNIEGSYSIDFIHISLQDFVKSLTSGNEKFDIIISNPPFFNNSYKSNKLYRNISRHTDNLSFADLIANVNIILSETGLFSIILPVPEAKNFIDEAEEEGLFCNKVLKIKPNNNIDCKRYLMYFSKSKLNYTEIDVLILRDNNNIYTEQYINLTKDYHLFFSLQEKKLEL